jgi:hypothetical protein
MELHLAICILIQPKRLIRLCVSRVLLNFIERKRAGQVLQTAYFGFVILATTKLHLF